MKLLTNKQQRSDENAKVCYIYKKRFEDKYLKNKKIAKVTGYCHVTCEYRGTALSICNFKYSIPKEIFVVFHNGSKYDYHFIIKRLAEKIKGQFSCLGENTEKYTTF